MVDVVVDGLGVPALKKTTLRRGGKKIFLLLKPSHTAPSSRPSTLTFYFPTPETQSDFARYTFFFLCRPHLVMLRGYS